MSKVEQRVDDQAQHRERDVVDLQPLSREVPNIDAAVAEIARYSAELTLPQGTIHVLSDVHGEEASFVDRGAGGREALTMARMQKAAAVMQLKLEGQLIARHSEWQMEHRRLLHRINRAAGTVELDGVTYPLKRCAFAYDGSCGSLRVKP